MRSYTDKFPPNLAVGCAQRDKTAVRLARLARDEHGGGMTSRWLFVVLLVWSVLLAPAMAAPDCAVPRAAVQVSAHCAHGDTAGQHAPAKTNGCGGVCCAIEARAITFALAMRSYRIAPSSPAARLPEGVLVEGDTPPPRLS